MPPSRSKHVDRARANLARFDLLLFVRQWHWNRYIPSANFAQQNLLPSSPAHRHCQRARTPSLSTCPACKVPYPTAIVSAHAHSIRHFFGRRERYSSAAVITPHACPSTLSTSLLPRTFLSLPRRHSAQQHISASSSDRVFRHHHRPNTPITPKPRLAVRMYDGERYHCSVRFHRAGICLL